MAKKKKNNGFVYDAFDLIKFIWDKKWILMAISFIAFVASVIVSLTITPRFKSRVIMFPAASVSVSKNLVETSVVTSDTKDILTFGEDEEAERLLQILYSDKIRDHITQKFHLMEHYDIDTNTAKYPYTLLVNKYKSNVKFRRTEFMSIEIDVLDTDPQMAADIANDIASYVDSVYYQIKLARAYDAFLIVAKEYDDSKKMILQLTDSLTKIRSRGVFDYKSQSEGLNKAYAEALGAGKFEVANIIKKQLDIVAKYGGIYVELDYKLEWEVERNALLKAKLAAAKVNLESTMSNVFIVDRANKSERKAVPKRTLIVIVSTLSTFILALLLLLIIDNLKVRS
jgi:capsular polysaccharide biosynthesis protein